jgi:hypothetical protein
MVRRIGALVVLAVVVYSVVRVATALVGGDDPVADADVDATAGSTAADVAEQTGDAGTGDGADAAGIAAQTTPSTVATTTMPATTTTEAPESTGPPSSDNPATVYVVGDSDAGTFGPYLEQLLDGTQIAETELNYKVSSGLARPDFFDWPAELARTIPEVDPDIVVATFGGNDANILRDSAGNDLAGYPESDPEKWTEIYQARVEEVMDILGEGGRTVIWVGIPNDDNPEVTTRLEVQDQAVRAAAAGRDNVVFIDTWNRFSGRDGNWAEYVIDPRDGTGKDVRADDGFHLNVDGAEILAIDIAQAVQTALRDLGAAI